MVFNQSKKYAFPPEFKLEGNELLTVRSELKILGIMVQNDLKWESQVKQMVDKATKKIWLLRRMKQLKVDERTITNYWKAEGRVHLEASAALWAGGITVGQARQIQRVQRRAVAAITGGSREEYAASCLRLGLEPDLSVRRLRLCRNFATRTATKSRHQDLFSRVERHHNTRGGGKEWVEPACRTRRHQMSARPHLTRLLNGANN